MKQTTTLKIGVDIEAGTGLACGQVDLKPRVTGRNRTELRNFCAHSMKGCRVCDSYRIPARGKLSAVAYHGFKTPGTIESVTLEKDRSITMSHHTTAASASRLPRERITPLPNNEPTALPLLWNTRYSEIDENFDAIDRRLQRLENGANLPVKTDLSSELHFEWAKLSSVTRNFRSLYDDGIINLSDKDDAVFWGSLKILEDILPRLHELKEVAEDCILRGEK